MIFNSIDFAIFLPIVFILYWIANKNLKAQNLLIVIASYVFYGWWDWRFLFLILFSTIIDYTVGRKLNIEVNQKIRKALLWTSILFNIGLLGVFKYYDFFLDNLIASFSFFGATIPPNSLNIILPVGISFYTFQTLSYTIDVYKRKLEPTKDFVGFSAFVSFFPQLVAGPIERASHLLPQFYKKRRFNYNNAVDGLRQILWGLFKKIVIADGCAEYANLIFNNSSNYSGTTLLLGAFFFAMQIYGDFSGYSDIAIGTSRLFGFNLRQNFAFPYFSRNIAEFWRRWHISLSTWFRDYLYIPLGGSQGSTSRKVRNTFIIFGVSGFWHGANWTFVFWGLINALYFLPLLLTKTNRNNLDVVAKGKFFPSLKDGVSILFTFFITNIAWVFFRADNLKHALSFVKDLFLGFFEKESIVDTINLLYWQVGTPLILFIFSFILLEWINRDSKYTLENFLLSQSRVIRWFLYLCLVFAIIYFSGNPQTFIYFQF